MQNSVAKKIFAVGSAVAMTLSLAVPFTALAAVHADGTNVNKSGTIGMIVGGQFRPYTSAGAFLSYGFNSWASVVDANAEDMSLPTGSFIPPQDGKIFCAEVTKDSDVKGECSLITGGQKAAFTSAAVFTGLGFSFSKAVYGDSSFMSKTTNIDNTTAAHRPGVLVNNNGTVQLVGATGLLGIPDLATFNSWGYSFANVVPANAADKTMTQTGVMAARVAGQLSPTALASTPTVPGVVTGSVSASLSSDTPAGNSIVAGQAIADLAHFTLSGSGTITQVVLKRIGVSSDNTLSNVYLYIGNNKITDSGSVSNSMVTFSNSNGLFTVNGSATISVKADILAGVSGQTVGMQLASYTIANGTPMTTSISGNLMNVSTVSDLATVTLTALPTGPGTEITAGTMNASLWSGNFNVSQRKVNLKYVAFKQVGSIPTDAIQNLKLYVAGVPVGNTANLDSANNVVFDMSNNPVVLNTGSQTVELRGDIVKGSSFNFSFRLQTVSDIVLVDSNYNVNIASGVSGTGAFPAAPTQSTTVKSGTVSIQLDPAFTTTQVVSNSSNLTLGQWTMKAYGENVKVQSLQAVVTFLDSLGNATTTNGSTAEGFNNLAMQVNGGGVGSSQNAVVTSATSVTKTFGSTNLFTIDAGQTVNLAVKGDMSVISGTKVASVRLDLYVVANTFQGVTSYATSPSVAATYTGKTLTVVSSSVTTAKNSGYANQNIASNMLNQKIGSFVVQASNADGVRVTSLTVAIGGTLNSSNPTQAMANLYVKTPNGQTNPSNPQSSNNFSVDFTVAANTTATVDVYADITNSTGTATTSFSGSGTGVTSGQAVYLNATGLSGGAAVAGQTVTVGSGVLSTPTKTSASPLAQLVVGGKTAQPLATYNFVSTSSSITITEVHFTASGTSILNSDTPITKVTMGGKDGTVVANTFTITGLNLVIPSGYAGLDVPVTVDYASVGLGGITSNKTVQLVLDSVKYVSGSNTVTLTPSVASNYMTVVGTIPTVSLAAAGGSLTTGTIKIGSVVVTADAAGQAVVTALPIAVSTSGTVTLASSSSVVVKDTNGGTIATTDTGFTSTGLDTITFTGGYTIAAGTSKTFDIYATIGGSVGTGGSSRVTLGMGAAASFLWNDVNGNVTGITGSAIYNYPNVTVSLGN